MEDVKEIRGDYYKKVEVDRVRKDRNTIVDCGDTHFYVVENPEIDIEPKPGHKYIVRFSKENYLLNGTITGFKTLDGAERFDSWEEEREWIACPKPGELFNGIIDWIDESGNKVIDIDNEFADAVLVNKGDVGDEIEARLTRKSDNRLIGRVIEHDGEESGSYELSEDEKERAKDSFENAEYESNQNDLIGGNM